MHFSAASQRWPASRAREQASQERCEVSLGLRIIKLALVAPEVDGHLQLMPLLHQPKTLGHEARVHIHELFTKPVDRAHRLLKVLVANDAPFSRRPEHAADFILHHRDSRCGLGGLAPLTSGLGAGIHPFVGRASHGARTSEGPLLEKDPRIKAN